jgi:hypothetical protein
MRPAKLRTGSANVTRVFDTLEIPIAAADGPELKP